MPNPKLQIIWMTAAANLRHARQMLSENVAPTNLTQFDEYLDHNELELAMHELEHVGRKHTCSGGFWQNMQRAADTMNLTQDAESYRQEFARSTKLKTTDNKRMNRSDNALVGLLASQLIARLSLDVRHMEKLCMYSLTQIYC